MQAVAEIVAKIEQMAKANGEHRPELTSLNAKRLCKACSGSGYIYNSSGEAVAPCECRIERKLAFIPEHYQDKTLSDYRETSVLFVNYFNKTKIRGSFPRDFDVSKNYFIAGKGGLGKSHLLWSQYRECIKAGVACTGMKEDRLLTRLRKQKYDALSPLEITNKTHFFIDDMAKEKPTEDRSSLLFSFLDEIYDTNAKLTITCNYSLEVLAKDEKFAQNTESILQRIKNVCEIVYFK